MNERKKAMKEAMVQADSGASQTGLRSPEHTEGLWWTQPCSSGGLILRRGDRDHGQGYVQIFPKADALRIVQCVNAHDDLVAALERVMFVLDSCQIDLPDDADRMARAALAKAKGEA